MKKQFPANPLINKDAKSVSKTHLVDRLPNPQRERITRRRRNPHRTSRSGSSRTSSSRCRLVPLVNLRVGITGFIITQGFRLAPAILLGSRSKALSFKRKLHRHRRRRSQKEFILRQRRRDRWRRETDEESRWCRRWRSKRKMEEVMRAWRWKSHFLEKKLEFVTCRYGVVGEEGWVGLGLEFEVWFCKQRPSRKQLFFYHMDNI